MTDIVIALSVLVLVPAGLMLLIRPVGRIVFFFMGVAFFFGIVFFMDLRGPDNPAIIIPFFGLALSAGAALSEAIVRLRNVFKRKGLAHG